MDEEEEEEEEEEERELILEKNSFLEVHYWIYFLGLEKLISEKLWRRYIIYFEKLILDYMFCVLKILLWKFSLKNFVLKILLWKSCLENCEKLVLKFFRINNRKVTSIINLNIKEAREEKLNNYSKKQKMSIGAVHLF